MERKLFVVVLGKCVLGMFMQFRNRQDKSTAHNNIETLFSCNLLIMEEEETNYAYKPHLGNLVKCGRRQNPGAQLIF